MNSSSLASAVANVNLQVTPENVLDVRAILLTEADRLGRVNELSTTTAPVGLCGGDPVSAQAAAAFNARIGLLLEQCQEYVEQLRAAARKLEQIARGYGHTEDEIASSYQSLGNEVPS